MSTQNDSFTLKNIKENQLLRYLGWTSLVETQSPDKRSLCGTLQFQKIIKNFVNCRTLGYLSAIFNNRLLQMKSINPVACSKLWWLSLTANDFVFLWENIRYSSLLWVPPIEIKQVFRYSILMLIWRTQIERRHWTIIRKNTS